MTDASPKSNTAINKYMTVQGLNKANVNTTSNTSIGIWLGKLKYD